MSELAINAVPVPDVGPISDEIGATLNALSIFVDGVNITAFTAESEPPSDHLELPTYYLAEWIAENWWAILWEPRKSEDSGPDSGDFLSRHSLISAEQGFLLPQLMIVSNGRYINLSAQARRVQNSDVHFYNRAVALIDRPQVEDALSRFVAATAERLRQTGYTDTHLQACWDAVQSTEEGQRPYCEMMGALGLSPYAPADDIDAILDKMVNRLGEALTRDLCLVAKPFDLTTTAAVAHLAVTAANQAPDANLNSIVSLPIPVDNLATKAWERGVRAARQVRDHFGIAHDDASGANRLFETVEVNPSQKPKIGDSDFQPEGAAIVGAVIRNGNAAKMSFIQRHEAQRRFAAGRAIFSAWTAGKHAGHLLTQAVTRHQQASRAFAAEMVAPISLIKKRATRRELSKDEARDVADELAVGYDVVFKQAVNNGLSII